jgi:hypothetical protein
LTPRETEYFRAGCGDFVKLEDLSVQVYRGKASLNANFGPFGCADKPAEKHSWLICCERKILFRLKKQAEKRRIISRMNRTFMSQFPMHLYFGNSAEEFHPHETLSTPMKLLSFISSLTRFHVSIFNVHKT